MSFVRFITQKPLRSVNDIILENDHEHMYILYTTNV